MKNDNTIGPIGIVLLIAFCLIMGFGIGAAVISAQWCHAMDYDVGGWDLPEGTYCYNEIEAEKVFPNDERYRQLGK